MDKGSVTVLCCVENPAATNAQFEALHTLMLFPGYYVHQQLYGPIGSGPGTSRHA